MTVVVFVIVLETIGAKSSTGGGDISPSPFLLKTVTQVGFAVFATLTPQIQPHSKKMANAIHLFLATLTVIQNKFTTFAFMIF